jgi:hypothetical protein
MAITRSGWRRGPALEDYSEEPLDGLAQASWASTGQATTKRESWRRSRGDQLIAGSTVEGGKIDVVRTDHAVRDYED